MEVRGRMLPILLLRIDYDSAISACIGTLGPRAVIGVPSAQPPASRPPRL
ncbi:hypothetical protein IG631_24138 [Alternaria alternata]|nr:hypothetical protein IG631_24138 [Alternaria alternata]